MKPRMDTLLMDLPERKFSLRTRNAISAHLGLPPTELQVRHAVGLSVYELATTKNMGEKGIDQVWALACSVEFDRRQEVKEIENLIYRTVADLL